MTGHVQVPFAETVSFVDNPEPRCPCVLLLDTSTSMEGRPIEELKAGLKQFREELAADAMASKRVELAIVTFGPVRVAQDFVTADVFMEPKLKADGDTPMGRAIKKALEIIHDRKVQYQAHGIAYYRPWVFMITDGAPTDDWHTAAEAIRDSERDKGLAFFPVGVDQADMGTLRELSVRAPIKLRGLKFRELFVWLSNSLSGVSRSQPGDALALPAPDTTPGGWAQIA